MEKNFTVGDDELDDDIDSNLHIRAMEAVTRHTFGRVWKIKPKRYYVDDKAVAAPVGKKV